MIEIVARIGDSAVEIAQIGAGGSWRAHDGSMLVVGGKIVAPAVTIGLVEYRIERGAPTVGGGARDVQVVPRPRIAKRPLVYLAASLVVQLAIWLIAVTTAPFERLERPAHRIARITHIHVSEPPPPPEPAPAPPTPKPEPPKPTTAEHAVAATSAHRPTPRSEEARAGKPRPESDEPAGPSDPALAEAEAIARLGKTFDEIDVKGQLAKTDGPLVDANTEDPSSFGGGGHHFNADAVAPEQTYAVQRWALPTFIRTHKGELAPVPAIEWCDEDSCLTRGALPMDQVLAILARHEKQIAQCYREHTGDLVGNVRVRFPIGADGKVTGTLGTETGPVGYGTGTVGRCIAKIAQGIRWPQGPDETYVFVGLAFRPASG